MRSSSDSLSSSTMSCDFERGFHSACEVRGHFSRSALPCLRLSVLDGGTVVSILILLTRTSSGELPWHNQRRTNSCQARPNLWSGPRHLSFSTFTHYFCSSISPGLQVLLIHGSSGP